MLLPAYELEGWTTTLPAQFRMQEVIDLYKDHATHEQFGKTPSQHSEFKTDMDLERLPSGKFDTNLPVCSLAAVAMTILCLIGRNALIGKDAPLRHAAKRRRMKFDAWRRAKFETELDISEKIKRISGGRVIGSRIQVFYNKMANSSNF